MNSGAADTSSTSPPSSDEGCVPTPDPPHDQHQDENDGDEDDDDDEEMLTKEQILGLLLDTGIITRLQSQDDTSSPALDHILSFQQIADQLYVKLEHRPARDVLVGHNILRVGAGDVAPSLHATQLAIKFQNTARKIERRIELRPSKHELIGHHILAPEAPALGPDGTPPSTFHSTAHILDHKLESRPAKGDLVDHHILISPNIAPTLLATQQQLKFQTTASSLDHKLEHRPAHADLVDSNIIRVPTGVAPSLAARQQEIKFQTTASTVDHKLGSRPPKNQLVVTNIIRTSGPQVSSVIQERQEILKFKKTKTSMKNKISVRPGKDKLVDRNILKTRPAQIEEAAQKLQRLRIRGSLTERLEQRPGRTDTRMRALLGETDDTVIDEGARSDTSESEGSIYSSETSPRSGDVDDVHYFPSEEGGGSSMDSEDSAQGRLSSTATAVASEQTPPSGS
eukprot:TRINITY_DN2666_c0_g1_i3.p1 TRINITY_DN2666_c0_g1~~TRINITY_DN2666_c0_g1_i3.p1  ORF type:complete len:454 (-),score=95.37 TRINITY_DN2666_c0_g1_i3:1467-2828(-)